MREPARDKGRLEDIAQAIDYAIQFAENLSFDEFVMTNVAILLL